jgi:hypothetical protein
MIGMAAIAALGVVALTATAQSASAQAAAAAQPAAKKAKAVKDTGEYDIYNEVIKDSTQPNAAKKFLTDLDTWTQKYPETDFKDTRIMYYVQAYAANNDVSKAMDTAKPLVDKGIDGLKDALDGDNPVLTFLFKASSIAVGSAVSGAATPEQLATGAKAAQMLSDFGKAYFAADKKPAATDAAVWAQGLTQVSDQAKLTLFQIALAPGAAILKKNPTDPATCAAAEEAFKKTLQDYPDSGVVAQQLAAASRCQQATSPAKVQQALYLYARAAVCPVGGVSGLDAAGQKTYDDYLKKIYIAIHGSDDGLAQLKELAAKTPLPPADFHVKTATEIATEKEEEFRTKNPQLAAWMSIKGKLADTEGQTYFEGTMKGTMIAGENGAKFFKGTLVEAKPACRPKELLVAFPVPGQAGGPVAEVTIRLVDDQVKPAALTGKPGTGGEIQFNGAPSAFTREPFMLTLDAQKSDIDGLNMTPCAAAPPARKGPPAAAKKKAAE